MSTTTRYQAPPASTDTEREAIRLFRLVENVGEVALSAVLTVVHGSHEDTSTTLDNKS